MAEKVTGSFDWDEVESGLSRRVYPWADKWFDGDVWLLSQGADFDVDHKQFLTTAKQAASRMGVDIRIGIRGEGDDKRVVLQAKEPYVEEAEEATQTPVSEPQSDAEAEAPKAEADGDSAQRKAEEGMTPTLAERLRTASKS